MHTATVALAGVALALGVLLLAIRRARTRLVQRQAKHLAGRTPLQVDSWANLFGVTSRGHGQLRGNGALVLTADSLWFGMLLPARELTIPLSRVIAVREAGSHLGKSVLGHRLLRVEFDGADGPDAAAWAVRDPEGWVAAVVRAVEAVR